jgi:hypothetical protein
MELNMQAGNSTIAGLASRERTDLFFGLKGNRTVNAELLPTIS